MKVLSLFDGMSCGQLALERAGVHVSEYYASEIDKPGIQVCKSNYPNTIHVGSVCDVSYKDGILYTSNGEFNVGKIDLVIGGSPCQDFSFAGKQRGLSGPKSKLFFDYVRILNEVLEFNQDAKWLLENVKMKKKYENFITETLEESPIELNSALVSAQNRPRLYWTNIKNIGSLKKSDLVLNDILFKEVDRKYFYKSNTINWASKLGVIDNSDEYLKFTPNINFDDKIVISGYFGGSFISVNEKFNTLKLSTDANQLICYSDGSMRKLTPEEFEILQTVPVGYTKSVSDGQRYKMLGNGWTVDIIAHIFKCIKE